MELYFACISIGWKKCAFITFNSKKRSIFFRPPTITITILTIKFDNGRSLLLFSLVIKENKTISLFIRSSKLVPYVCRVRNAYVRVSFFFLIFSFNSKSTAYKWSNHWLLTENLLSCLIWKRKSINFVVPFATRRSVRSKDLVKYICNLNVAHLFGETRTSSKVSLSSYPRAFINVSIHQTS